MIFYIIAYMILSKASQKRVYLLIGHKRSASHRLFENQYPLPYSPPAAQTPMTALSPRATHDIVSHFTALCDEMEIIAATLTLLLIFQDVVAKTGRWVPRVS